LLDMSKLEAGKLELHVEQVEILKVIVDCMRTVETQATKSRIGISIRVRDGVNQLLGDDKRLHQMLLNLLSNAIKFTPEKGVISMEVRKAEREVEVFVKDTGLGMSHEAIQKINLNNYYTSKGTSGESGTGLGLLLCKEFLTRNGGRLHIESVPGKGSVFSFSLPGSE